MLLFDLKASMAGSDQFGYCTHQIHEQGVTSLLTAHIARCFSEYCHWKGYRHEFADRVSIVHQSTLKKHAKNNWAMDIALFYRFLQDDVGSVFSGCTALFPLLFMEFTKSATKSIEMKLPQAALYANQLFRAVMNFAERGTWVPLFCVVMSEQEMLFRLYSPSLVNNAWKIAEIDVMRCDVSTATIARLLHVMLGWTDFCTRFLRSQAAVSAGLNIHSLLRHHCNVVVLDQKIFKSYDYRVISGRPFVSPNRRRKPTYYFESGLTNVNLVVAWKSESQSSDSLQILSYDMVPGVHNPSIVKHLTLVMKQVVSLHSKNIVHGDLRFANIVFSDDSDAATARSTIIDYDYSGPANETIYPPHFNRNIPDGFRHAGANADDFLRLEHDVAALHWMCKQYHPTNVDLRQT